MFLDLKSAANRLGKACVSRRGAYSTTDPRSAHASEIRASYKERRHAWKNRHTPHPTPRGDGPADHPRDDRRRGSSRWRSHRKRLVRVGIRRLDHHRTGLDRERRPRGLQLGPSRTPIQSDRRTLAVDRRSHAPRALHDRRPHSDHGSTRTADPRGPKRRSDREGARLGRD